MTLKLVKSDVHEINQAEMVHPRHIVAFEVYLLQQSLARIIELARLYPEMMAANLLALSECFAAFAEFYANLARRK